METPLSRQLQQAWLYTQIRKQQPSPDLLPSLSDSPVDSPPFSTSNSSWTPSSDGSSASASSHASLPPKNPDPPDDHSLRDPVLQFLNDILMEEDMEDHKCMAQECTAYQAGYQATAKGFYDILGVDDEPGRGLGSQEQQQEPSESLTSGEYNEWMEDLLRLEGAGQWQEAPAVVEQGAVSAQSGSDLSPLYSSNSSGSAVHSPQQSSESTCQSSNESTPQLWNAAASPVPAVEIPQATENSYNMVSSGSSPLNFENKGNGSQNEDFFQQLVDSGARLLDVNPLLHGAGQKKTFRRVVSDNLDVAASKPTVSYGGRFKRAASERDSGSSGVAWDSGRGEVLSYVQNKDLNAERLAEMLQGGPISSDNLSKNSSFIRREGSGVDTKGTRTFATTVDLMGLLMSCADAVAADDLPKANEILQQIRRDATPYGEGIQRLAHYFAEGLVARLSGTGGRLYSAFTNNVPSAAKMLRAHHMFVEVSPFVEVCQYVAHKAILKVAEGASRLHIVDYGILYGLQWPSLISALADRKGGPPLLRITGIDFPRPGFNSAERVEMTGRRLQEYAKTYGVEFEYRAIASKWETIQPSSLNLKQNEVLVVNSMFRLRHLLDETVLASNPRKTVLSKIRSMNPKVFVMGIKNGSYNSPFFKSRFKEALFAFSCKFDMMDTMIPRDNQDRLMIEREVMGRDIINVISCEGPERVERPETYRQWQNRTQRAGFEQMPLDARVVNKAREIVKSSYNKNFGVDEDGGWMRLSWKGQIANCLSLWKPSSKENT